MLAFFLRLVWFFAKLIKKKTNFQKFNFERKKTQTKTCANNFFEAEKVEAKEQDWFFGRCHLFRFKWRRNSSATLLKLFQRFNSSVAISIAWTQCYVDQLVSSNSISHKITKHFARLIYSMKSSFSCCCCFQNVSHHFYFKTIDWSRQPSN